MALNGIRTSTITSKGQIVIPSEIRSREGFRSGQKVVILAYEDRIEIKPLEQLAKKIDWEAERKMTRAVVKAFVKKHKNKLKKAKNWEFTSYEKNGLAKSLPE